MSEIVNNNQEELEEQEEQEEQNQEETQEINDAGNPVVPITSAEWHQPDPAQQGAIFCKSGPYVAPGQPV